MCCPLMRRSLESILRRCAFAMIKGMLRKCGSSKAHCRQRCIIWEARVRSYAGNMHGDSSVKTSSVQSKRLNVMNYTGTWKARDVTPSFCRSCSRIRLVFFPVKRRPAMALFEVPGWTMSSETKPILPPNSKKRKRPSGPELEKVQTAEVNIEKLMKKLDRDGKAAEGRKANLKANQNPVSADAPKERRKRGKGGAGKDRLTTDPRKEDNVSSRKKEKGKDLSVERIPMDSLRTDAKVRRREDRPKKKEIVRELETDKQRGSKKQKKEKLSAKLPAILASVPDSPPTSHPQSNNPPLTALQANMKQSLDGARFR